MPVDKPSKNARKREQHELQRLGEDLIPLKSNELEAIGLNEELLAAVHAARRMKSHGALRRQKQLIGKLMRQADVERIRARLTRIGAQEKAEKQRFARAEKWRDRLLTGGEAELQKFETATAGPDAELRRLLGELAVCANDRTEKTLQRQVFRRIHSILVKIAP